MKMYLYVNMLSDEWIVHSQLLSEVDYKRTQIKLYVELFDLHDIV